VGQPFPFPLARQRFRLFTVTLADIRNPVQLLLKEFPLKNRRHSGISYIVM
jgi:hypothetical protein